MDVRTISLDSNLERRDDNCLKHLEQEENQDGVNGEFVNNTLVCHKSLLEHSKKKCYSFIRNKTKLGESVKKECVVTTQTPKHRGQKMVLLLIL